MRPISTSRAGTASSCVSKRPIRISIARPRNVSSNPSPRCASPKWGPIREHAAACHVSRRRPPDRRHVRAGRAGARALRVREGDAGHVQPAEVQAARRQRAVARRPRVAARRREHDRVQRRRSRRHVERAPRRVAAADRRRADVSGGRPRPRQGEPDCGQPATAARNESAAHRPADARAWPRALRHLLFAVPQRCRRRRRHDRAPRLPEPAVVSHRPAAQRPRRAFLQRDHERLRHDVLVRRPRRAARPLGHRRLHPRTAALAGRAHRRRATRATRRTRERIEVSLLAAPVRRGERVAWIVGAAGAIAFAVAAYADRTTAFQSYLFVWWFLLGIPLGSIAMLAVHNMTGGGWGEVIRAPLDAAARLLPLSLLLVVPLLFGLADLYAWARPDAVAADPLLRDKRWY